MHFVHSLVRIRNGDKSGWCAPVELGEATPHYISFVIPVDQQPYDTYICEIVRIAKDSRVLSGIEMVKKGKDSFVLIVDGVDLWFNTRPISKTERRLPYIGRLEHEDFKSMLMEIALEEPTILDKLLLEFGVGVIGCDPFSHYDGIRAKHK